MSRLSLRALVAFAVCSALLRLPASGGTIVLGTSGLSSVDSGFHAAPGQQILIAASGSVNLSAYDGPYTTDPTGTIVSAPPRGSGSYNYFTGLGGSVSVGGVSYIGGSAYPYGALVGTFSGSSSSFIVGTHAAVTAPATGGELLFGVADAPGCYGDNVGSYQVGIVPVAPPPAPPVVNPLNPPQQLAQHTLLASLQPSFSWTPLTLSDTFKLMVPGMQSISWTPSVNFFPTQKPTISPWQHSFTVGNDPLGSALLALCPHTWDLGTITGQLGLQGSFGAACNLTLANGHANATINAQLNANVTAFGDIAIQGGLRSVPGLGSLIPSELKIALPIFGGSVPLGSQLADVPLGYTFSYSGFQNAISNQFNIPVPKLVGTVTIANVPITFNDTNQTVYIGINAQAGISLTTTATFGASASLTEVPSSAGVSDTSRLSQTVPAGTATALSGVMTHYTTSSTGTATVDQDGTVSLSAASLASPAWTNLDIKPDTTVNQIVFDAKFDSGDAGDGALGVYLGGNLVGLIAEANAGYNLRSYTFDLGQVYQGSYHVLAFRLDPTATDSTSATVSDVMFVDGTAVPQPTVIAVSPVALGLLTLYARRRRRGALP